MNGTNAAVSAASMVPGPIGVAASAVSIANGLKNLLGGGSKQSSVHQGWRVTGTLTRDGLTGSNTAFDQLGNTWGGAIEASSFYAPIFRDYLGDSTESIPVNLTVAASEGYNAGVVRQLREAFETAWNGAKTSNAAALPPAIYNQAARTPVSLFDPDPSSDTTAAPIIAQPTAPATRGGLFDWLVAPSPIIPAANDLPPMNPIVPTMMQANASRSTSSPAGTAQPGAVAALGGVMPLLILGAVALLSMKAG